MLYQRVLTGIIGGAFFLLLVYVGGYGFLILFSVLALVAYSELIGMRSDPYFSVQSIIGYAFVLMLLLFGTETSTYLLLGLFLLLSVPVVTKNRLSYSDISYYGMGALYIGLSLHAAVLIRLHLEHGLYLFLFVLLCIWASDTMAYFVGGLFKGPKLWPAISPNKTFSGALGGLFGSSAVGYAFFLWQGLGHPLSHWMVLAIGISLVGQIGDFVESAIKRSLHVKDSGVLLPGHGGVLDRFDSLLFASPFAYHVFVCLGF
ncbi:phosphatidate cytidylyltransferase [Collibacillus ludicampi]|uniref:Phosphatidate cytidylyltransferase n=1 Tax=Collibacillus ludicampi TaxID=2771369 RepID=A0AAV4LJM9_9BACL|nr:phosphatidate cytidylyltransferase [Collibacillus ludicampi]GIM47833.1 phosphatidate cytidylyltransferase [Collibacillus ludicampi]